jgi:hypothetical protein
MTPAPILTTILAVSLSLAGAKPEVTIDASAKPALEPWLRKAATLAEEWHPRLENLLADGGPAAPNKIRIVLRDSNEGVAHTSGGTITIMSGWLEKQPDDFGLVVHEVVHIVQNYQGRSEFWVVEGIADYLRWAIYEGKPLAWFPVDRKPDGYRGGYRVAGGFLLWLESVKAPGIVRRLNTALRKREYRPELIEQWAGAPVGKLYEEYCAARTPKK